jgi:hypothetical protein
MSKKNIAIAVYLAIGILFAIYGTFWGAQAYRGFFFNLGSSLIWPAILFPALGKAIGALVILAGIVAILIYKK